MRATRKRTLFPIIINPFQREMLSYLALTFGLSRGEVIRRLIIRETATQQLAHQAPTAATRTEAAL